MPTNTTATPSPTTQWGAAPPITKNPALIALWPTIASSAAAQDPQVNPQVAFALAVEEGGINPDNSLNTSPAGAIGIMQLEPSTAAGLNVDPYNNSQNIDGGMRYLSQQLRTNGGNYALALAAYNAGPGAVKKYGGVPPFDETQKYVSTILANAGIASNASDSPTSSDRTAVAYKALTNNDISQAEYNALTPEIVITDGLSGITPWYKDPGLITGNPRLRQQVEPVTFKIYLEDFTLSSKGRTGQPIVLQLNASMKSYSLAMKHLFTQQKTRTAFHITMWGMQADMLEGQCTTGVFMNQFGLTDYFSTFRPGTELQQLLSSGVGLQSFATTVSPDQKNSVLSGNFGANEGGVVSETQTAGSQSQYNETLKNMNSNNSNITDSTAFRVAAQDAFQELLSLFKMNGSVWLWNKTYSPQIASNGTVVVKGNPSEARDWTGIDAWSPAVGMSASQINSRNNDALTRGAVVMEFRNFVYEGYFKSLQWTMDASNPFRWDFSFNFQIERTVGREYVPS